MRPTKCTHSKRFADSNGWGYGEFEYEPASHTFRPGTTSDQPPQGNDAKCGFGCHQAAKNSDYVFTRYPRAVRAAKSGAREIQADAHAGERYPPSGLLGID